MERVIVYIDGFNLYFGMREKGWRRYYWLNVHSLAKNLLKPYQELVTTKYFTSRVSSTPNDPEKAKRQGEYLEALNTVQGCEIFYGHYLEKQYAAIDAAIFGLLMKKNDGCQHFCRTNY